MTRYKVLGYYKEPLMYHECRDEENGIHYMDLRVNGDIPKDISDKDLVGKTVEIEWSHPWIEIGHGVKIVNE